MEWLRWANVILSTGATWLFVASTMRAWPGLARPQRMVSVSICSMFIVIGYGSGEALHQEVPFGFRVALVMLSLLSVCVALAVELHSTILPIRKR